MTHSSKPKHGNANYNYVLTSEQIKWLENRHIPERIFLIYSTDFDDKWIVTSTDRWKFRVSGRNNTIDFNEGVHYQKLDSNQIKLIKIILLFYVSENTASKLYDISRTLALAVNRLASFSHESIISLLNEISPVDKEVGTFYSCLYASRKLDVNGFFTSTDGNESIEDKLLFVPRPATSYEGIYRDVDSVIPQSIIMMIENGIKAWSMKLTPTLSSIAEKHKHLNMLSINIDALRDCIILGLCFITGSRPVQLSKLAVGDIFIDTESQLTTRFALMLPYAKTHKINLERIAIALPDELGKLIFLYIRLALLMDGEPLLPQEINADRLINDALARQLFRFAPKEMQDAVLAGYTEAPVYRSSQFRHNVGHSMAMSGASAEEIAYMLGHSGTTVASYYISVTPNLAEIRENALGTNPVYQSMIALMMTGNLIYSSNWHGRKVAGNVAGKLHYKVGGCNYGEPLCPFCPIRTCYGCLYFVPFIDGNHLDVFNSFNEEIMSLLKLTNDTHERNHPLIPELTRRKHHVMMVMTRIDMFNKRMNENHG
ncbi:site-specific integrase [Buttiauxella gaviniae]|uniref:site-specific integrase n=1 Tax=Buttiauxella gaviniae TaxID=82990 RepID=UPI003975614B